MKKSKDKPTKAGAVELSEDELGQAAGGVKLQDVLVTGYQHSGGAGSDLPSTDPTLDISTPKR